MTPPKSPVLVVVGPTAVGKTALSLSLAKQFNGEILSADSRLFYRGMDIGTAKPTPAQLQSVAHHFIDICEPDETVGLSDYQKRAYLTTDKILAGGRLPIIVGGTGQYVMATIEGWGIPEVAPQPALRAELETFEAAELGRWLVLLDPQAADNIDARNKRRVIRALEVILVTGQRMSVLQEKHPPDYDFLIIGLMRDRQELYQRIDDRVDRMMADGLLAEVAGLRAVRYERRLPSMSGLGYRQLWAHLEGEMSLDAAIERIKFETHRFVRRQGAWFHDEDPRIQWFDLAEGQEAAVTDEISALVEAWLDPT